MRIRHCKARRWKASVLTTGLPQSDCSKCWHGRWPDGSAIWRRIHRLDMPLCESRGRVPLRRVVKGWFVSSFFKAWHFQANDSCSTCNTTQPLQRNRSRTRTHATLTCKRLSRRFCSSTRLSSSGARRGNRMCGETFSATTSIGFPRTTLKQEKQQHTPELTCSSVCYLQSWHLPIPRQLAGFPARRWQVHEIAAKQQAQSRTTPGIPSTERPSVHCVQCTSMRSPSNLHGRTSLLLATPRMQYSRTSSFLGNPHKAWKTNEKLEEHLWYSLHRFLQITCSRPSRPYSRAEPRTSTT